MPARDGSEDEDGDIDASKSSVRSFRASALSRHKYFEREGTYGRSLL